MRSSGRWPSSARSLLFSASPIQRHTSEFVRQSLAAARAHSEEASSQGTRAEYEEFRPSQFNRMRESPAGRATFGPLFGFADPSSRRGMQLPSEPLFEDDDHEGDDDLEEDFFMSPTSYFQRLYREFESAGAANRGRFIYNAADIAAAPARRRQQMERLRISEVDERLRARYSLANSAPASDGGMHSTASSTTAGGPARPSGQTAPRPRTNATNPSLSQMRYYNHLRVASAYLSGTSVPQMHYYNHSRGANVDSSGTRNDPIELLDSDSDEDVVEVIEIDDNEVSAPQTSLDPHGVVM